MKTKEAVQDVVAMTRAAHRNDSAGFNHLMPMTLEEAQLKLTMACALIDVLTAGPKQEEVMDQMINLAESLGDKRAPEPGDQ